MMVSEPSKQAVITKAIIWLMETNELPEECKQAMVAIGLNPVEVERDIRKLTDAIAE